MEHAVPLPFPIVPGGQASQLVESGGTGRIATVTLVGGLHEKPSTTALHSVALFAPVYLIFS